ncbi:MAG: SMC family ATPase [Clostridia bacterium]|nr:SMC family ATPase [Clostridia bacterium]
MKPIRLTIEGINSFVEEQTVDFERVGVDNLFCISGTTGSGKTTILDCIILSLYEKHSERGNLEDYINLRCEQGKIVFTFDLNDEIYETTRIISRKKSKNSTLLRNLTTGELVAEGNKAFDFLHDKIGLDVKEFTNVVVLQQGEFSRFLKAKKSDRVLLVSKLFDLSRFDGLYTKFNGKASVCKGEADACEKALEGYGDVSDESISLIEKELEKCKTEVDVCRRFAENEQKTALEIENGAKEYALQQEIKSKIIEEEKKLAEIREKEVVKQDYHKQLVERESRLIDKEKERDGLITRLSELKEVEDATVKLEKKASGIDSDEKEVERLNESVKTQQSALFERKTRREESEKQLSTLKEGYDFAWTGEDLSDCAVALTKLEHDKKSKQTAIEDYGNAQKEYDTIITEKKNKSIEWDNYNLAHAAIEKNLVLVQKEKDDAQKVYEELMTQNAVALVSLSLSEGDVCPVCGNKVHERAQIEQCSLDKPKADFEQAKKAYEEELARYNNSTAIKMRTEEALAQVQKRAKEYEKVLQQKRESALSWEKIDVDALTAKLAEIKRCAECVQREREEEEKQRALLEKNNILLEEKIKTLEQKKKEYEEEKRALEKKTAGDVTAQKQEISKKLAEMKEEREKVDELKEKFAKREKELQSELTTCTATLVQLRASVKDCSVITSEQATVAREKAEESQRKVEEIIARQASLQANLANEKARLLQKKKYIADYNAASKRYNTYAAVAKLFNRNAFAEFVAAEYIKDFTLSASERLGELTGGKYSLEYDEEEGEFFVRDFLAGNEKRSVKTLSGGETFLASLSLAIAISQDLSKSKDYDFFFIDEGFGTLSPDAIDMVVSALETLATGTMVGVITHRNELIERIPAVVKVSAPDEEHGSKVTY